MNFEEGLRSEQLPDCCQRGKGFGLPLIEASFHGLPWLVTSKYLERLQERRRYIRWRESRELG